MLFGGETAESYYEEGLTASMKGDMQLAVRYFQRALELDAGLDLARHQMGKCWLRLGNIGEALTHFRVAAERLGAISAPTVDLGYALLQRKLADEARDAFSRALTIRNNDSRAILGLAYCAFYKGQYETALGLAQRTIAMGRLHYDTHYLMLRAAVHAGQDSLASEHLEKALALMEQSVTTDPDQPTAYYLRGELYLFLGHFQAALENYESALKRMEIGRHYAAYHEHFEQVDVLERIGRCQQALNLREAARDTGHRLLQHDPEHPVGKTLIGL